MDGAVVPAVLIDIHDERRIGAGSDDLPIGPGGHIEVGVAGIALPGEGGDCAGGQSVGKVLIMPVDGEGARR